MMKKILTAVLLFCAVILGATAPEGWLTDFDQAKTLAQKQNKKIMLLFTGSDWCGWCIKLKKDVFEKQAFKNFAKKNIVPVYVDFPRRKKLSQEQIQHNRDLQRKYMKGGGYPTAVLLTADGEEITRISGFRPNYMDVLEKSLQPLPEIITAVKSGDNEKVRALAHGKNLTAHDHFGVHVLSVAFQSNNPEGAGILIEKGVLKTLKKQEKNAILGVALQNNAPVEILKKLLKSGVDINAPVQEQYQVYPIHYAVYFHRDPAVTELLLDHGADLNRCDKANTNVFHLAAMKNSRAMAELLLKRGANKKLLSQKANLGRSQKTPAEIARDPELKQLLTP